MAIRDNRTPRRPRSASMPNRRLAMVYTISAAMAGAAGALLAQTTGFASLDVLDFHRSADVLLVLVIGGMGWLYGGVIGAVAVSRDAGRAVGGHAAILAVLDRPRARRASCSWATSASRGRAHRLGALARCGGPLDERAFCHTHGLSKSLRRHRRHQRREHSARGRRAACADRSERRGQDDARESPDRHARAVGGHDRARRRRHHAPARAPARAARPACERSRSTSCSPVHAARDRSRS